MGLRCNGERMDGRAKVCTTTVSTTVPAPRVAADDTVGGRRVSQDTLTANAQ